MLEANRPPVRPSCVPRLKLNEPPIAQLGPPPPAAPAPVPLLVKEVLRRIDVSAATMPKGSAPIQAAASPSKRRLHDTQAPPRRPWQPRRSPAGGDFLSRLAAVEAKERDAYPRPEESKLLQPNRLATPFVPSVRRQRAASLQPPELMEQLVSLSDQISQLQRAKGHLPYGGFSGQGRRASLGGPYPGYLSSYELTGGVYRM